MPLYSRGDFEQGAYAVRRLMSVSLILLACLLAMTWLQAPLAMAQTGPQTTEEPPAQPVGEPTLTPMPPSEQPPPTEETPNLFGNALTVLINARNDLELLATSELGRDRPEGWNGSLDINDPQLPLFIRLDLEVLARTLLGSDSRPEGWFGAIPSSMDAIARDIRHDLELLADAILPPDFRPPGWSGGEPLMRCDRSVQTLVQLLIQGGVFTPSVDPAAPDYCQQIELEATRFAEVNLLSNPKAQEFGIFAFDPFATPPAYTVVTDFAVAFLDRSAVNQVGVIPNGTGITPIGRSYAEFSKMTLVQGDGFLVFVDYRDTNLSEDEWRDLPNADTLGVEPFCGAEWCLGG